MVNNYVFIICSPNITMKLLFICNQNQNRSRTAEEIFRGEYETKSAGLYNEKPVTKEQLEWADIVVVMEDSQRKEISRRFPEAYMKKKIISLEIPDIYVYNDENLIRIIKQKMDLDVKPVF